MVFETFNDTVTIIELTKDRTDMSGYHSRCKGAIQVFASETGENDERRQSGWSVAPLKFELGVS